jgi:hypothetical protein
MYGAPVYAAPAYLGCFKAAADDGSSVLPKFLAEQLTANNIIEQCWQLAANDNRNAANYNVSNYQALQPLFGIIGRKCYGGKDLTQAAKLGAAPESACAANSPDVSDVVVDVVAPAAQARQLHVPCSSNALGCCSSITVSTGRRCLCC